MSMKQTLFLLCLLTTGLSAQTTTDDHIRARSSFRIGATNSTAARGITNRVVTNPAADTLVTSRGVYNWATGTLTFSGDVSGLYNNLTLANSGVTAGTCTNCSLTIDAKGRVTVKGSGSAGATYTAGSGINIDGSNVISNTAPDQTVTISGASGTYPNFTLPTKENVLTFGNGLTRTGDAVANDFFTGKAGGQTLYGGTASGESLTLSSTTNATKGKIFFGTGSAYDGVNMWLGIGTASPATKLNVVTNSLGVTQTETAGITVANTTAATNGAQQISPAVGWNALGYGTTAGTSQAVDYRAFVLPVQGTVPTGTWQLQGRIGAGAWTNRMSLASAGDMTLGGGSIILTSTAMVLSENIYKTVNNGVLALYNGGGATSGILLYGTTHATAPNVTAFKNGGAEVARFTATGQLAIGTTSPATSAALDITSTTGALLLPRMTSAQRDALTAANGMVIYNTTTDKVQARAAGAWVDLH